MTPPSYKGPLGEFETLLLLAILQLEEQGHEAYGSAIREEIARRTGRSVPRGSIYVTLDRLESKGLLVSREGGTTPARGQRAKRLFAMTSVGVRAVRDAVESVTRMRRGLASVPGR